MAIFIKDHGCGCDGCSDDPCIQTKQVNPTILTRTSTATKYKCGFEEYINPYPAVIKVYLKQSQSGTVTNSESSSGSVATQSYAGNELYDRTTCGITDTTHSPWVYFDGSSTTSGDIPNAKVFDPAGGGGIAGCSIINGGNFNTGICNIQTLSTLSKRVTPTCTPSTCASTFSTSGYFSVDLSDEYTTAMLITDVEAALPPYSGSFYTGIEISAGLSIYSGERDAYAALYQYKFQIPNLTGYSAYKIDWDEKYTPEAGGGEPVITHFTYTWNGSDTETSLYYLTFNPNPGTINVVNVVGTAVCA